MLRSLKNSFSHAPSSSTVVCLDCTISPAQEALLSLDLKFVPRLSPLPHVTWREPLRRFIRGVFLCGYFGGTSGDPLALQRLYAPSTWTPDVHEVPPDFVAFTHSLREYCGALRLQNSGSNLSLEVRAAIMQFKSSSLIACPADKGSTVVAIPVTLYESLCLAHLDGPAYAKVTDIPPVNRLLLAAAAPVWHSLPPRVQRRLEQPGMRFPNFYGLPKLHKTPLAIRPILSSINSDTYWWAVWLHLFLWPSVMDAPTTLIDSIQLARQLEALTWPEDGTFLTMDIVQLYTSIKHEDGLRALAWHIRDSHSPALRGSIMEVMHLCLHHNYFSFAGLSYHQVSGTAMGSPVAPAYASIFMLRIELLHLTILKASATIFCRYLDDLFAILPKQPVQAAVTEPQTSGCPVSFTTAQDPERCVMLDLQLSRVGGQLSTSLHFKATNRFTYIHPTSNHPAHTQRAIALGEFARASQAASDIFTARQLLRFLGDRLLN